MANPFDQFDAAGKGNPFDQFDGPPAPTGQEAYAAAVKRDNQAEGAGTNFVKSLGMGAAKRVAGLTEYGANIAQALGADVSGFKSDLADVEKKYDIQGTGTGVAGTAGEILGDPLTYAAGIAGKGVQGMRALAGLGGVTGAVAGATEGTGDKNSTIMDNAANSATGGIVGALTGGLTPIVAKPLEIAGGAVMNGTRRIAAALGSDSAAESIFYRDMAQKLLKAGTPAAEVEKQIADMQASGMRGTIGEATGNRSILQSEARLARGAGAGATDFNNTVVERGATDIPAAIDNRAATLAQGTKDAKTLYPAAAEEANTLQGTAEAAIADPKGIGANVTLQSVEALNKPWQSLMDSRAQIAQRLEELGGVNNVESKALAQAKAILDNAERRGASFESILDAKKQLDTLFIDGADSTAQKQANRFVTGFTKDLDASLEAVAPGNYPAAKAAAKMGMAGRELGGAVDDTAVGDVTALYKKLWSTPEQRADFLARLPDDATRSEYQQFFTQFEKVANGHGGQAAGIAAGGEGSGVPLTKHGVIRSIIGKLEGLMTPEGVNAAQASGAFAPDVSRLTGTMGKLDASIAANPVVKGVTSVVATDPGRMPLDAPKPNNDAGTAPLPAAPSTGAVITADHAPTFINTAPVPAPTAAARDKRAAAGDTTKIIADAATSIGNDPDMMRRIAMLESGGDATAAAPTSSARGLYQFTSGTWKNMVAKYGQQYGITNNDRMNPQKNAIMGNLLVKENSAQLKTALGRDPNPTEVYLAHFLGIAGAKQLLANLDKPVSAAQLLPSAAGSNSKVFFAGGDPAKPLTPAGIYRTLTHRLEAA